MNPTGRTVEPSNSTTPTRKRSGAIIQPLKNPFVNLAKISSSERSLMSICGREIVRESTKAWWFLGFMRLIVGDLEVDGESVFDSRMVCDLEAGRG